MKQINLSSKMYEELRDVLNFKRREGHKIDNIEDLVENVLNDYVESSFKRYGRKRN